MNQRTIKAHISTLRNKLKLHSDDSNFTDQYLYKLLSDARSDLLRKRIDKRNTVAPYVWQTICVPLIESTYHDCSCINVGCSVLKSTIDVPNAISSRNFPMIRVVDFAGRTIPYTDEKDLPNNKYSKIKKDKPTWTMIGSTLFLFNDLSREMVQVRGIFEDPFEISQITTCENGSCYDISTEYFPIDADLNQSMYKMITDDLMVSLQISPDLENDSKSNN